MAASCPASSCDDFTAKRKSGGRWSGATRYTLTTRDPVPVAITNVYDFDHSKAVQSADYNLAYASRNHGLPLITVP